MSESEFLKAKKSLMDLPPIRDEQNLPFDAWERYCYLYNFAHFKLSNFLYYSCWPQYQGGPVSTPCWELTHIHEAIINLIIITLPKPMVEEIKDRILASMSIHKVPENQENNPNRYYCHYCVSPSPNPIERSGHQNICFGSCVLKAYQL